MAANPILILGAGDAGARAIAQAKRRLREIFGKPVPGVEFMAVLASDSVTRQSDEILKDAVASLRSLIAMELARTASSAEENQWVPDAITSLVPRWLSDAPPSPPGLLQELTESALRSIARDPGSPGPSRKAGTNADIAGHRREGASTQGEGAGIKASFLDSVREELRGQARREADELIRYLNAQERELGLAAYGALLQQVLVQIDKVVIPRVQAASEKLHRTQNETRHGHYTQVLGPSGRDAAQLLACEAFEATARELAEKIRSLLTTLERCRQIARAEIGSDPGVSLALDGSRWMIVGEPLDPASIADMAREFLIRCNGCQGAVSDPAAFHEKLHAFCQEKLAQSVKTGLLLQTEREASQGVTVLDPDEFRLISPEHDLDPSPSDPNAKDRVAHFGFSRKAASEAFFSDTFYPELNRRIAEKIDNLIHWRTSAAMNDLLKPFRVTYDTGSIQVFALADAADTLGGALVQDLAGMAVQQCDPKGLGRRSAAILLTPRPLAGDYKSAEPQAKAYATLKEIYHWRSQHMYQHTGGPFEISVLNNLFDAVYVLESTHYDPDKAGRDFAATAVDFILMHMFDTQQRFVKLEDKGANLERPVISFGAGRLVCPEDAIRQLDSYRIAAEAARRAASEEQVEDGTSPAASAATLSTADPHEIPASVTGLWEVIQRIRQQARSIKDARAEINAWWDQCAAMVRQALDEGAIGLRFPRAEAILSRVRNEISRALDKAPAILPTDGNAHEASGPAQSDVSSLLRKQARTALLARVFGALSVPLLLTFIWLLAGMPSGLGASLVMADMVRLPVLYVVGPLSVVLMGMCAMFSRSARGLHSQIDAVTRELRRATETVMRTVQLAASEYVWIRDLEHRADDLARQLASLKEALRSHERTWRLKADELCAGFSADELALKESGTLLLVSRAFVDRHSAAMEREVLGDPSETGPVWLSRIKLSKLLGKPGASIACEFPAVIGAAIQRQEHESLTVLSVLSDMAHEGEDILRFLSNLKRSAHPRATAIKARVSRSPDPLDILGLANPGDAEIEPLKGALEQAGISGSSGRLEVSLGAEPHSIVLCEIWDDPVDVNALAAVQFYYRHYMATSCTELLSSDPGALLQMEEIAEVENLDEVRKTVVKAIVLGLYAPPEDPTKGIAMAVEAMRVDPARLKFLNDAIDQMTSKEGPDPENLRAWLDWVVNKREWWSGRLGLIVPDLRAVTELIEEISSGRRRKTVI